MLSPPTVTEPRGGAVSGQLTSASSEAFNRKMAPFQNSGAVLSWYVAQNVQSENYSMVSLTEKPYRSFDPQRPLAIDVMNGLNYFAHDPNPLMIGHAPLAVDDRTGANRLPRLADAAAPPPGKGSAG